MELPGRRDTPLPVTVVRFQPQTDGNGVAAAGTPFTLPFTVQQQGTERRGVDRLTVETSYDNGNTFSQTVFQAYQLN